MVTLGIVGMGYIGRIHYAAARALPDVEVAVVASSRPEEVRRSYPEIKATSSYHELLGDDRLDAVIVCVPTFLHERIVIEAANRGRHVLCEKPLALDSTSAWRMVQAVQQSGVVFMVSQVLRFWPEYVLIQDLMTQGRLGSILSVTAHRLAMVPPWGEWFTDPAKSGGCLLDLQVHDLDFIVWALGRPLQIQTSGLKSDNGCWNHIHTLLRYDHAMASIEASYMMPSSWPLTAGIRVVGSSAAVEYTFRSAGDVAARADSSDQIRLYCAGGEIEELVVQREDMFVAQLKHFAQMIKCRKTPPVCPIEQSYEVMGLLDASKQSAEGGEAVELARSHPINRGDLSNEQMRSS